MKQTNPFHYIIFFIVLFLMLYYGLTGKNYDRSNHLIRDGHTLIFSQGSLAMTEPGYVLPYPDGPFQLEMTIRPVYQKNPRFQCLFLIHNGQDDSQLLVGQWSDQLVLMNGTDYSNARKEPKLYVSLKKRDEPVFVRIESDKSGMTEVFLDGELTAKKENLVLTPPPSTGKSRLILGSNINNTNSWTGTLFDIKVQGETPTLLYPEKKPLLRKKYLIWPDMNADNKFIMIFDIFINTVGFIPLGFILPLILISWQKSEKEQLFYISLSAVFLFSLLLETAQVWIPTRNSSSLDLLLNTLGGSLGAGASVLFNNRRKGKLKTVSG